VTSTVAPHQIHTYAELRQQIHDDLRLQHPEWIEPNGESPICDSYEARLMETARQNAKKGTMSMRAIAARFTDKSVNLDDAEERRVLTMLGVIYEGGSLNGKSADFPTRDLSRVVIGLHQCNRHFFETYERTICIDIRSQRTIFRYAGLAFKSNKSNYSSWWKRLLALLRIRKVKAIVI
jgi:hypothetical protein